MIEIRGLHCGYGAKEILNDINLEIQPGQITAVLGPNGSGKTTLMLAITRSIPFSKGAINISGRDIHDYSHTELGRSIASVAQKSEISFPYKCLSVALMGRYPHLGTWGGYTKADYDITLEAMELTNCLHLADRPISAISGGEAQTVSIARALAQDTDILLLDEATSHLDVARKIEIFDLIASIARKGKTILTVMHDLNLAALYSQRMFFMKKGRIALEGATSEVFNSENLSEIYETEIQVIEHPITGRPQALFVPDSDSVNCSMPDNS